MEIPSPTTHIIVKALFYCHNLYSQNYKILLSILLLIILKITQAIETTQAIK